MKSFFKVEPVAPPKSIKKVANTSSYTEPACSLCGLDKGCKWPRMEYSGEGKLGILAIAEAPEGEEDETGKVLIGEAGTLFKDNVVEEAKKLGIKIDYDRDLFRHNVVNCRPSTENRTPTSKEINYCKPFILNTIKELQPKFIWLMGASAIDSILGGLFPDKGMQRWFNWCIPDQYFKSFIIPMYHPSYILRNEKDELITSIYRRQIQFALKCLGKEFPDNSDYESKVDISTEAETYDFLEHLLTDKPKIAFDYETTGLKPYGKGQRVKSVAIATEEKTVSFILTENLKDIWCGVLENPEIKKIAQNIKFEDVWSAVYLKTKVQGWEWCTMVNSHILNSAAAITGLKFQVYAQFGIRGYDDEISHYLNTIGDDGLNLIDEVPIDKLLLYNGLDAYFTYLLWKIQKEQFDSPKNSRLNIARKFFHDTIPVLSETQQIGIYTNKEYFIKQENFLGKRIERQERILKEAPEAQAFTKAKGKEINLGSPKDLKFLFFDVLGLESIKKTTKGNASVDVEVLEKLDNDFARGIVKLRKWQKIRGTYLSQYLNEIGDNGIIHPFFDIHIPSTYRSSSSNPNLQNVPKRSKEAKRICRTGIIPFPGFQFVETDYSSLEVRIIACYTEDKILIKYIKDQTTDMHRDEACYLFKVNPDELDAEGMIRFYAKNKWVFPEFYGSYYKNCAKNLWQTVVEEGLKLKNGLSVKEHLRSKGINSYTIFENHCRNHEKTFWARFPGVKAWQERVIKGYIDKGYVETFLGFRRTDCSTRNQIINAPIQGTAYHCLQWSWNKMSEYLKDKQSKIIIEVHDSTIGNVYPPEITLYLQRNYAISCIEIRKEYQWLIVPLDVEVKIGQPNVSWYDLEKFTRTEEGKWVGKKSGITY